MELLGSLSQSALVGRERGLVDDPEAQGRLGSSGFSCFKRSAGDMLDRVGLVVAAPASANLMEDDRPEEAANLFRVTGFRRRDATPPSWLLIIGSCDALTVAVGSTRSRNIPITESRLTPARQQA